MWPTTDQWLYATWWESKGMGVNAARGSDDWHAHGTFSVVDPNPMESINVNCLSRTGRRNCLHNGNGGDGGWASDDADGLWQRVVLYLRQNHWKLNLTGFKIPHFPPNERELTTFEGTELRWLFVQLDGATDWTVLHGLTVCWSPPGVMVKLSIFVIIYPFLICFLVKLTEWKRQESPHLTLSDRLKRQRDVKCLRSIPTL